MRRLCALSLVAVAACGTRTGLKKDPPPIACEGVAAEPAGLDVLLLVETSERMGLTTEDGRTRWEATRAALDRFLADEGPHGSRVQLTHFPRLDLSQSPGPSASCKASTDCAAADCRFPLVCPTTGKACVTSLDCEVACAIPGVCEGTEASCTDAGACGDTPCTPLGRCVPVDYCSPTTSLTPSLLLGGVTRPEVPFALSLLTHGGEAPTVPAWQGFRASLDVPLTLQRVNRPVVLFVTGGPPTLCGPDDAGGVAADAALSAEAAAVRNAGAPTFVLVVASGAALAWSGADVIAEAGGTGTARRVKATAGLEGAVGATLREIRATATRCERRVPSSIIPRLSEVEVSAGGYPLHRVGGPAACDWGGYYLSSDLDPQLPPMRLVLCPDTCLLPTDEEPVLFDPVCE